ncbi:MAG: type II secretion system protein GspG [Planctomycetota bacterium]|nr:type II secretion system protein GspG [Planctomycetota bacterium]
MRRFRVSGYSLRRAFTLIELLVVIAILGILATFILGAVGSAKNKARIAIASSQIKSLTTALEAYNTDVGFYPRDANNLDAGDLPHLLFAALNNKPTTTLGGGPNAPYFDAERTGMGILNGSDFRETLDNAGEVKTTTVTATDDNFINTNPLDQADNPSTVSFQTKYNYSGLTIKTNVQGVTNYPAFVDPWGNAYHYREWASKSEAIKETLSKGAALDKIPHNFNTFDIWCNGPDGVNQHGHPDSDDVSNWGG